MCTRALHSLPSGIRDGTKLASRGSARGRGSDQELRLILSSQAVQNSQKTVIGAARTSPSFWLSHALWYGRRDIRLCDWRERTFLAYKRLDRPLCSHVQQRLSNCDPSARLCLPRDPTWRPEGIEVPGERRVDVMVRSLISLSVSLSFL
jgi:hypothetical protein